MESENRSYLSSPAFRSRSLIFSHVIRVSRICLMEDEAWFAPNEGANVNAGWRNGS